MLPPAIDILMLPNLLMVLRHLAERLTRTVRTLVPLFFAAALSHQAVGADDADIEDDPLPPGAARVDFHVVFDQIPVAGTIVLEKRGDGTILSLEPGQTYEIRINRSMLMQSIFGRPSLTVRDHLERSLRQKIEFADCICGLTAAQKEKLELAGRGDIVRLLRRVDDLLQTPQSVSVEENEPPQHGLVQWGRKFVAEVQPLRHLFASGIFIDESLFGRTRDRTLTAEQRARYSSVREIERAGGKFVFRPREAGSQATTEIQFSATKIDDGGLAPLKSATGLHSLLLDNTRISDAGLANLTGLVELEILDLRHTQITDAGLQSLPALTNLKSLRLDGTKITDVGLVHLKKLARLEYLHLGSTSITGAGFVHLKDLTNLRDLYLGETQVDDAALARLRGLTLLEHLSLADTRITNAGLAHLSGLTHLKRLFLIGTEVTADGTIELRQSLPKLTIIR
jgi:hypothetical protein